MGIGQDILDIPFGEMVYQVAAAIATSQAQLDRSSIEILRIMGDSEKAPVFLPLMDLDGRDIELKTSMIGAGFQPTFYQFSDAIIEVKMAISMSYESGYEQKTSTEYGPRTTTTIDLRNGRITLSQTNIKSQTVNATYTNKYNFNEEASSTLRVRLVPLPPNPTMQRLIELRARKQQLAFELDLKRLEAQIAKDTSEVAQTT